MFFPTTKQPSIHHVFTSNPPPSDHQETTKITRISQNPLFVVRQSAVYAGVYQVSHAWFLRAKRGSLWWIVDMMMVVCVANRAGTQEEATTGVRCLTSKPGTGRSA
jgi:hypothetical protein